MPLFVEALGQMVQQGALPPSDHEPVVAANHQLRDVIRWQVDHIEPRAMLLVAVVQMFEQYPGLARLAAAALRKRQTNIEVALTLMQLSRKP